VVVSRVNCPGNLDIMTGTGPAVRPATVPAPRPHERRDPWLRMGSTDGMTLPLAGQPGHGRTAFVRGQPARIVDGRFEGGYTGLFELICPGCGDHPYLDYAEIPPRLQWLRGPRLLEAALKAYDKHLGPPGTNGDSAGSLGLGWTNAQEHLIRRPCRAHPRTRHPPYLRLTARRTRRASSCGYADPETQQDLYHDGDLHDGARQGDTRRAQAARRRPGLAGCHAAR
jgi:hypothetical protein